MTDSGMRGRLPLDPDANSEKKDTVRETIKVILVDDHELARHGIRKLLGGDVGIEVVGEAESCWGAISLISRLQPEVVILDIRLRQGNGVEVSRAVRKLAPATKILVLSAYDDSQYVVSMVKLGVSGYLTKSSSAEDLIGAVHFAAKGWLVFSPDIADKLANLLRRSSGTLFDEAKGEGSLGGSTRERSEGSLTGREAEVLQHMFRGLGNRDIADALGISSKTVEIHIHRILLKLGAKNRSQAIVNSLGLGYLQGVAVPARQMGSASCGPLVSQSAGGTAERAEGAS
jgi:DNA-binding NarL/FixJ family response regulator